jgi:8-oxo-dGTP diphosphatase
VLAEIPRPWKLEFAATPVKMVKAAKRELARRNAVMRSPKSSGSRRRISWVAPCYLYVLESGKLVIDRRHKIGTLKPNDAEKIVSYWPHGRNADYIRWRIRTGPTCAIRRNGKLVAWAITHGDGAMGILHVLKEFRGLGMARSITTALAERSLRAGIKPFLYIVKRNKASIRLTESMGFTRHGIYCWFGE